MTTTGLQIETFAQFWQHRRRQLISFFGNIHETHGTALHVIKTVIAALLALVVSLLLDMSSPRTAVFCVFLVMQTQTGLVFQKSFYRLLGTAVGAFVAIMLIGTLGQTPELFFFCFALWIAFCAGGSLYYRNFQSYGFVLAGYTVCFVAFPSVDDPGSVFQTGVIRVLEMFVGVFCAAAVSDIVFPDRMFDAVILKSKARFKAFCDFLLVAPQSMESVGWARNMMLKFTGDVLGLASAQSQTSLESNAGRQFQAQIQLLNHDFMKLTTSVHAFHELLRRLDRLGTVKQTLLAHYKKMTQSVFEGETSVYSAKQVMSRLDHPQTNDAAESTKMNDTSELSHLGAWDLRTGLWLLSQTMEAFQIYCKQQLRLESLLQKSPDSLDSIKPSADLLRFSTRTDPLLVAINIGRAMCVLLLTTMLWTMTGWPLGYQSILNGVATSTLFATLPNPAQMLKKVLLGWLLAFPLGLLWNFWILPQAFDLISLALLLTPPFILIAWLSNSRKWAPIGIGLYICFILHTSIDHEYRGDITSFIDLFIADFFGFAIPSALYLIVDLTHTHWAHQRQVKQLRNQLVAVCTGGQRLSRERLESASRDLSQKIATQGTIANESDAWLVDWMLSVLELGWAIIDLREISAGERLTRVQSLFGDLADLFRAPTAALQARALTSTELILRMLEQSPLDATDNQIRLRLLLIRSALLNASSLLIDARDSDA